MKNDYEIRGEVTHISIKRKDGTLLVTTIETKDFPLVDSFKGTWIAYWNKHTESFYVKSGKNLLLHRFIMMNPKYKVVDHADHDTLNNKRNNLRSLSNGENMQNRKGISKNNTSGFRGVHFCKKSNKWIAALVLEGKKFHVGRFVDLNEAGIAAENARKKYFKYA